MTPPEPMFSAVIPTFNRARFVPLAVESVLRQSGADFEIIVVDDGSVDDTAQALQPYLGRIRCLRQENRGVSAARNAGLAAARGRWLVFLDSDDEWQETYFAELRQIIHRHPRAAGIVLNSTAVALDGVETDSFAERELARYFGARTEMPVERPFSMVLAHRVTTLQSFAAPRGPLLASRRFDESLTIAEDLDLIAEMALRGPFVFSTALAARVIRRAETLPNLSTQFMREGIRTRLAWARVYGRFLQDRRLTAEEVAALRRTFASNQRALGNLHLRTGSMAQARSAYRTAWSLDHSVPSLLRWGLSLLPSCVGRRLLHKEGSIQPAVQTQI